MTTDPASAWPALGLALLALAAVALHDAWTLRIPLPALACFALAGSVWRIGTGPAGGDPLSPAFWVPALWGALLGAAVVLAPILAAEVAGRRWPILPGDGLLLAATGLVLGPPGLTWAVAAGALLALLHRACIQRRRGRPFRRGYAPAGTGFAGGAAAVLLAMQVGAASAQGPAPGGDAPMPATVLAPQRAPLPPRTAGLEVRLEQRVPLPFATLARRVSRLAGLGAAVEERPSRIAGGAAELPPPAPMTIEHSGGFAALLDLVAARSGYSWEYAGDRIVWFRYWDREQPPPSAPPPPDTWKVDPDRHRTVEDVLADWADRAGWTLVWKPRSSWTVAAPAEFRGTFIAAVDALLSGEATRRTLVPVAYAANRHLVVEGLR